MKIYQGILIASAALIANSAFAVAAPVAALPAWEIIMMGGPGPMRSAQDIDLDISSVETDKLIQTNSDNWTAWTGQLGTGYIAPLGGAAAYSTHVQWFTAVEPQMNVYYLQGDLKGNVDRYANYAGDFNDNKYTMEIKSTRLMADVALTVASWRRLSTYVIGGIGPSWNSMDYNAPETVCVQEVEMNSSDVNFAWEVGAGLTYSFNRHFGASLEYLYASIYDLELGDDAEIGEVNSEIGSDGFDLVAQTVFLGLRYAF